MGSNFHSIALQSLDHLHHDGSAKASTELQRMRDILQQAMFWKAGAANEGQKYEVDDNTWSATCLGQSEIMSDAF